MIKEIEIKNRIYDGGAKKPHCWEGEVTPSHLWTNGLGLCKGIGFIYAPKTADSKIQLYHSYSEHADEESSLNFRQTIEKFLKDVKDPKLLQIIICHADDTTPGEHDLEKVEEIIDNICRKIEKDPIPRENFRTFFAFSPTFFISKEGEYGTLNVHEEDSDDEDKEELKTTYPVTKVLQVSDHDKASEKTRRPGF